MNFEIRFQPWTNPSLVTNGQCLADLKISSLEVVPFYEIPQYFFDHILKSKEGRCTKQVIIYIFNESCTNPLFALSRGFGILINLEFPNQSIVNVSIPSQLNGYISDLYRNIYTGKYCHARREDLNFVKNDLMYMVMEALENYTALSKEVISPILDVHNFQFAIAVLE